jgi:hypothetical protein
MIHVTQKTWSAFALILAIVSVGAYAGSETHSGQGIQTRPGGPIVLSDFKGQKVHAVTNNRAWAEGIADLLPLIKEIYEASPEVGALMYDQLMKVNIMTTDKALALAPPQENSPFKIEKESAPNAQAGYRDGNDVLFTDAALIDDLKAKNSNDDEIRESYIPPSYNVSHELLHGLVPGARAFHQMKVGVLNAFFREFRGRYTERLVENAAASAGVRLDGSLKNEDDRRAFDILLNEKGDFQIRCTILRSVWHAQDGALMLGGLGSFREMFDRYGYSACRSTKVLSLEDFIYSMYPQAKSIQDQWQKESDTTIREIRMPEKLNRASKEALADSCKDYASNKLKAKLDRTLEITQKGLSMTQEIMAPSSTDEDPARDLLKSLAIRHNDFVFNYVSFQQRVDETQNALRIWQKNRDNCQQVFPKFALASLNEAGR